MFMNMFDHRKKANRFAIERNVIARVLCLFYLFYFDISIILWIFFMCGHTFCDLFGLSVSIRCSRNVLFYFILLHECLKVLRYTNICCTGKWSTGNTSAFEVSNDFQHIDSPNMAMQDAKREKVETSWIYHVWNFTICSYHNSVLHLHYF